MKPKFIEKATLEYTNPWHRDGQNGPSVFKIPNAPIYRSPCGRGVMVKISNEHFDYLVDGKLITQRAGANTKILANLIDAKGEA